jgi:hypothetical protein
MKTVKRVKDMKRLPGEAPSSGMPFTPFTPFTRFMVCFWRPGLADFGDRCQ